MQSDSRKETKNPEDSTALGVTNSEGSVVLDTTVLQNQQLQLLAVEKETRLVTV